MSRPRKTEEEKRQRRKAYDAKRRPPKPLAERKLPPSRKGMPKVPDSGRKKKQPPAAVNTAETVRSMAADGFSIVGIAQRLGTSKDTFNRWLDERPELREAFEQGREQERHALHNLLYRQAMEKGNATAAMFLLKARHGYREGDQSEQGNRVQITFALPGALSMSDYQQLERVAKRGEKAIEHAGDTDQ